MTITKTTKTRDHYEIECKRCGTVVSGVSVKAARHNKKLHDFFCGEKKE